MSNGNRIPRHPSDPNIFLFEDWKTYLEAFLEARQTSRNKRRLADAMGVAAATVTNVINSQPGDPTATVTRYIEALILAMSLREPDESRVFRDMVQAAQSPAGSTNLVQAPLPVPPRRRFWKAHRLELTAREYH